MNTEKQIDKLAKQIEAEMKKNSKLFIVLVAGAVYFLYKKNNIDRLTDKLEELKNMKGE